MASNCSGSNNNDDIPSTSSSSSSSKTKDDLLNEILTCGICLSRMSLPCCLPCQHPFCRSCLIDYAKNNCTNLSVPINSISCPYCKFQLNFRSFEHFETLLIINPVLKQLCDILETTKLNNSQTNRARCHTCCSLKMLKVCKHCFFMLCDTCRRTHLLDVHKESKIQLDKLEFNLRLIYEKRLQMEQLIFEYNDMKDKINNYTNRLIYEIGKQRDQALRILHEQQHMNEEMFWTRNGFDNDEKLDFFLSLVEIGKKKLAATNITDKELMELSDNLQTMPNIDEKNIQSIDFTRLNLELDETCLSKQFIRIYNNDLSSKTTNAFEQSINNNEQTDSIKT